MSNISRTFDFFACTVSKQNSHCRVMTFCLNMYLKNEMRKRIIGFFIVRRIELEDDPIKIHSDLTDVYKRQVCRWIQRFRCREIDKEEEHMPCRLNNCLQRANVPSGKHNV